MNNLIRLNSLTGLGLSMSAVVFVVGCSSTTDRSMEKPMDRNNSKQSTSTMDKEFPGKRPESSTPHPATDPRTDSMRAAETSAENNGVHDTVDKADKARAVDNSGQNQVDKNAASLTPFDQGTSESDMSITQTIRKSLTSDSSLSTNAQNVKIITRSGLVALRGPVANQTEAETVLRHVHNANGVTSVDNQLAVP